MEQSELRKALIEAAEIAHRAYPRESLRQLRERETVVLLELAERAGLCSLELTTLLWSPAGLRAVKRLPETAQPADPAGRSGV